MLVRVVEGREEAAEPRAGRAGEPVEAGGLVGERGREVRAHGGEALGAGRRGEQRRGTRERRQRGGVELLAVLRGAAAERGARGHGGGGGRRGESGERRGERRQRRLRPVEGRQHDGEHVRREELYRDSGRLGHLRAGDGGIKVRGNGHQAGHRVRRRVADGVVDGVGRRAAGARRGGLFGHSSSAGVVALALVIVAVTVTVALSCAGGGEEKDGEEEERR